MSKNIKRGFLIWIWASLISFPVSILIALGATGAMALPATDTMRIFAILAMVFLSMIWGMYALGWAANKTGRRRGLMKLNPFLLAGFLTLMIGLVVSASSIGQLVIVEPGGPAATGYIPTVGDVVRFSASGAVASGDGATLDSFILGKITAVYGVYTYTYVDADCVCVKTGTRTTDPEIYVEVETLYECGPDWCAVAGNKYSIPLRWIAKVVSYATPITSSTTSVITSSTTSVITSSTTSVITQSSTSEVSLWITESTTSITVTQGTTSIITHTSTSSSVSTFTITDTLTLTETQMEGSPARTDFSSAPLGLGLFLVSGALFFIGIRHKKS